MNRQAWGFNLSFLFHAATIFIFVAIGRFVEMEQKPLVIDFSINGGSQESGDGSTLPHKAGEKSAPMKPSAKQREVVQAKPEEVAAPLAEVRAQVQEESPVSVPFEEEPVKTAETITGLASPGNNFLAQAPLISEGGSWGLGNPGISGTPGGSVKGGSASPIDTEFGSSEAPRFYHREIPQYPLMARKLGKEARVVLRLTIDEYGKLLNVEVLQGAEYGFTDAAIKAVRKSTFSPAIKNGAPVVSRAVLPVGFILRGDLARIQ